MRSASLPSTTDRHLLLRGGRVRGIARVHRDPLVLWHLLSLDAPTVASCWTAFVAWMAGVRISWVDTSAMFVAVWMLYATDRLLDAQPVFRQPALSEMQERHLFHHLHRRKLLSAICLAALPLAFLLHKTAEPVLHLHVVLVCLLGSWLLLVHARPGALSSPSPRLPKELVVGIFFPAAAFIPTVARAPSLRAFLLLPALLFGAVCVLNCLFLYAWEHPSPTLRADAHATTRAGLYALLPLASAVALLSGALGCALAWHCYHGVLGALLPSLFLALPHPAAFDLAICMSSLLFIALHLRRTSIRPERLRALADFVLLTPVLVFAAVRSAARF